jgi:hypothetical protein
MSISSLKFDDVFRLNGRLPPSRIRHPKPLRSAPIGIVYSRAGLLRKRKPLSMEMNEWAYGSYLQRPELRRPFVELSPGQTTEQ